MKTLHFIYNMHSDFSAPVTGHSFTLKCIPQTDALQEITIKKEEIVTADWVSSGTDSFGSYYLYGNEEESHTTFRVNVEGYARADRGQGCKREDRMFHTYIYPTRYTELSPEMEAFLDRFSGEHKDMLSRMKEDAESFRAVVFTLMQEVYQYMEYAPGTTTVRTTAAEAFAAGKGVCQDYAHIMTGFCKKLGIPAGYVAGYMIGEGASHAWVACADPATGLWYEIDPTNDKWVDDGYIAVSSGQDCRDCVMNKGIYRGFAEESQNIFVLVEEVDAGEIPEKSAGVADLIKSSGASAEDFAKISAYNEQ